jgi:hypothetical protein
MPNPFTQKAKGRKKTSALAKIKAKKQQADEPTFYGIEIPPPDLSNPWAKKKHKAQQKTWAESDKHDFTHEGVRICHVREHDGFWTIDVINNDVTYRFDNRGGTWKIQEREDRWREPKPWLKQALHTRWLQEIKRQGRHRGYLMRDEVERKDNKKEDKTTKKTTSKKSDPKKTKTTKASKPKGAGAPKPKSALAEIKKKKDAAAKRRRRRR